MAEDGNIRWLIVRVPSARRILLANSKMSDKLQFVVAFGSGRVAKISDKLKFVGHFQRPHSFFQFL
jgi:hypothetical protein